MEEKVTENADIIEIIVETINTICSNLFSSIDRTIFPLLDQLVFVDKRILDVGDKMDKIFSLSPNEGVLLLANCLFTAFVLYYSVRLIIAQLTGGKIESPAKFFMRAFLAGVAMNYSLSICTFLIDATNSVSTFFCKLGKEIFKKEISFEVLISTLSNVTVDSVDMLSLDGILFGMLSISSFALVISFAYRYILIKVLVILSPFAILCLSNASTEGFFKSWFKSLLSLLILQIIISIILLIPYALIRETSNDLFNKVLLVGSIISLNKANQFVKEFMGGVGIGTNFQSGVSGIKSMLSR